MRGNKVVSLFWKCPRCGVPITSNECKTITEFHRLVGEHRLQHEKRGF